MRKLQFPKTITALAACAAMLAGMLPLPTAAGSVPVLTIESAEITPEQAAAGETIAMEVTITDNTEGFLATSYGITYDNDLILEDVRAENAAGASHSWCINPQKNLVWFCGAGTSLSTENEAQTELMFTLYFSVPADAADGANYPVSFTWTKVNQKPGLWVDTERTDLLEDVQSAAVDGSIQVVDPNAPKLSHSEIRLTVGDTKTLSVTNAESVLWITTSDLTATVEDGVVTAQKEGECMIYAIADNKMLTCVVTVTKDGIYDIMGEGMQTIYLRDPEQKVSLTCSGYDGEITWQSFNENVVTVDSSGQLTGISNGSAMVFAYCGADIYFAKIVVEYPITLTGTGDVNLDGGVTIADVLTLNRNLMIGDPLNEAQQKEADVNLDQSVDSADMLLILQRALLIVEELPLTAE
ncbi:MAG: hypothetical protein II341_06740 [Oscillospiraceae bacterium]|nr:hypothetical protein [Oscillospiraceae bacterium]